MKVHVIHENPGWYAPLAAAFDAQGVPHEPLLVNGGVLDLGATPPPGVFWSRMSASSHTRGHLAAKDHTRALLCWLESHDRRVVNGRPALELEMSKVNQLTALAAAGFDVPRTVAVVGRDNLVAAAGKLPVPFIAKPNQGGKGLGVQRFDSHEDFASFVSSAGFQVGVDGITLLQEYVPPARPVITRVEVVGGQFIYAIEADTRRGGFELCPAEACAVDAQDLFTLREGFDNPVVGKYLGFAGRHGIEIAGFEFIETADGRMVTYDVNTTTNYNAAVEAVAPRPALPEVARFLGHLLAQAVAEG